MSSVNIVLSASELANIEFALTAKLIEVMDASLMMHRKNNDRIENGLEPTFNDAELNLMALTEDEYRKIRNRIRDIRAQLN